MIHVYIKIHVYNIIIIGIVYNVHHYFTETCRSEFLLNEFLYTPKTPERKEERRRGGGVGNTESNP